MSTQPVTIRLAFVALSWVVVDPIQVATAQNPGTADRESGKSKESRARSEKTSGQSEKLCRIEDKSILELSGITCSQRHKDHFWVHNDSGADATVYLLNQKGKTRLTVELKKIKHIDFEDIASFQRGTKSFVAVADVGDNLRRRKSVQIHIFEEPELKTKEENLSISPLMTVDFTYPDGQARDCEAVAYFPTTKQLLVCSKLSARETLAGKSAELFTLDFELKSGKQVCTCQYVGPIAGGMITAMDCSRDGKRLVVRNYIYGNLFDLREPFDKELFKLNKAKRVNLPFQRQGEAICFGPNGRSLFTASEGKKPYLFRTKITNE